MRLGRQWRQGLAWLARGNARCASGNVTFSLLPPVRHHYMLLHTPSYCVKPLPSVAHRPPCAQAIQERYGVPASQLRLFVHYQPSYYHLHVHFVHVSVASHGTSAGKAIVLDDVIGAWVCTASMLMSAYDRG